MPIITITVENDAPLAYSLDVNLGTVTIGRSEMNNIQIQSDYISLKHAELRRVEGGFELHDLDSRTGIHLNGYPQKSVTLIPGMILGLGNAFFQYALSNEEIAILENEKHKVQLAQKVNDQKIPTFTPPTLGRSSYYPPTETAKKSSGALSFFAFLLLGSAALFGGAFYRHQQETGKSLIDAIVSKVNAESGAK